MLCKTENYVNYHWFHCHIQNIFILRSYCCSTIEIYFSAVKLEAQTRISFFGFQTQQVFLCPAVSQTALMCFLRTVSWDQHAGAASSRCSANREMWKIYSTAYFYSSGGWHSQLYNYPNDTSMSRCIIVFVYLYVLSHVLIAFYPVAASQISLLTFCCSI